MPPGGEKIGLGLGLKLGGPKCRPEQMIVYMQDARIVSETVIESGGEADKLHAEIASLGALGFPVDVIFSTSFFLL